MKKLIVLFLILIQLTGCAYTRVDIAKQQSLVVELTINCNKGNTKACNQLEKEKPKLLKMIGD